MKNKHHINLAVQCACRTASDTALADKGNVVILSSDSDVSRLRRMVGTVMPDGSTNSGSSWQTPTGTMVSIKRYSDPVPAYQNGFRIHVCNGGRALSSEEVRHVRRWENAGPVPVSLVGA